MKIFDITRIRRHIMINASNPKHKRDLLLINVEMIGKNSIPSILIDFHPANCNLCIRLFHEKILWKNDIQPIENHH